MSFLQCKQCPNDPGYTGPTAEVKAYIRDLKVCSECKNIMCGQCAAPAQGRVECPNCYNTMMNPFDKATFVAKKANEAVPGSVIELAAETAAETPAAPKKKQWWDDQTLTRAKKYMWAAGFAAMSAAAAAGTMYYGGSGGGEDSGYVAWSTPYAGGETDYMSNQYAGGESDYMEY
jgi:hypothetical protein